MNTPPDFAEGLLSAIQKLGRGCKKGSATPARGNHKTVTLGISYGNGQMVTFLKDCQFNINQANQKPLVLLSKTLLVRHVS